MKRTLTIFAVFTCLALSTPAFAVSKEIIQLQQMVQSLSDQVRDLNRLVTEKMLIMSQLVEKASDNTNKLQGSIDGMQRTLQSAIAQQSTSTTQRLDGQQTQLQRVSDSVEEMKARQAKLSEQIAQMKQLLETIQTPPAPVTTVQPMVPVLPPAPQLYDSALRDLSAGKSQQAMSEFQDYLRAYPNEERAENSQYYIGEIYYLNGEFPKAIESYTAVIDRYPKGNKTASAHLKKGFALLEMKQQDAGVKELRTLIGRFSSSEESKRAKERLSSLGVTTFTPSSQKSRPKGRKN